jgi:hypothetical protein
VPERTMRIYNGQETLPRLHALIERLGTDEQRKRVWILTGQDGPSRSYKPAENSMYMAEALVIAYEMIGELQMEVTQLRQMVAGLTELPTRRSQENPKE